MRDERKARFYYVTDDEIRHEQQLQMQAMLVGAMIMGPIYATDKYSGGSTSLKTDVLWFARWAYEQVKAGAVIEPPAP